MAMLLSSIEVMNSDGPRRSLVTVEAANASIPLFRTCPKTKAFALTFYREGDLQLSSGDSREVRPKGSPKESAGFFQKRQDRKLVAERNGVGFGITAEEYRRDQREKRLECEAVL